MSSSSSGRRPAGAGEALVRAEHELAAREGRKPRKSPVGLPTWEITLQFVQQERSWNKFRASNGELDYLRYKGTGLRPHPTADFNQLFLP